MDRTSLNENLSRSRPHSQEDDRTSTLVNNLSILGRVDVERIGVWKVIKDPNTRPFPFFSSPPVVHVVSVDMLCQHVGEREERKEVVWKVLTVTT